MTKRKTLFFCATGILAALAMLTLFKPSLVGQGQHAQDTAFTTKYGAFLAAQHAVYVNDFESAGDFITDISDVEYEVVRNMRIIASFLAGKLPDDVKKLESDMGAAQKLVYDAYLAKNDKWDNLYNRHKSDKSALYAPFRIWSAIAKDRITETMKFIDTLESNQSWKSFVRGQIYAQTGRVEQAKEEFSKVSLDFMNINDYVYIMSFYTAQNFEQEAAQLKKDFSSSPGGMFMADNYEIPKWSDMSGVKNALAFNLVQNVSHTQIMLYSDLSVLMLQFAHIIGPDTNWFHNAVRYYLGQHSFNTNGNYAKYFDSIGKDSPFFLFAKMRDAEATGSVDDLRKILRTQPLFIPALNRLVAMYTRDGDQRNAVRIIDKALDNKNISDAGRAHLFKRRALVNLLFGDLDRAQSDIHKASKGSTMDREILTVQARIWAAQNREIENAYDYAMTMVKQNPTDIIGWDTLATVISVREGNDAALDILERISSTANSCSSLFEHLGDAYAVKGQIKQALDAYARAVSLADDGLSILPNINKKIRKLK